MNWGMIWLSWIAGSFIFLFFEMKILDRRYSVRRTILRYALLVCFNCGIKAWSHVVKGVESYSQYAIIPIVAFLVYTLVCFKDKIGKRVFNPAHVRYEDGELEQIPRLSSDSIFQKIN